MPQINNNSNKIFYNIVDGKIVNKCNPDSPNAVKRENKKGVEIYEQVWDELNGVIVGLTFNDHVEYGKSLMIDVNENGVVGSLQLSCNSNYFKSFVNRIKAIDNSQVVLIASYSFPDKIKKKRDGSPKIISGINMFQNGTKVLPVITKENPLPNSPTFPEDTSDKVAMVTYNVEMEKLQVEYINTIQLNTPDNLKVKTQSEVTQDESHQDFEDFPEDDITASEDEDPFK